MVLTIEMVLTNGVLFMAKLRLQKPPFVKNYYNEIWCNYCIVSFYVEGPLKTTQLGEGQPSLIY